MPATGFFAGAPPSRSHPDRPRWARIGRAPVPAAPEVRRGKVVAHTIQDSDNDSGTIGQEMRIGATHGI